MPLPGLSDPELVSSELGQAVGARDDLVGFLRGKELLILLDNFEHLLDAAPAVSALLSASGGLQLLVTSRSPLHLSGEQEFQLEPLSSSDAAVLLVERAARSGERWCLIPRSRRSAVAWTGFRSPSSWRRRAPRSWLLSCSSSGST